MSVEDANDGGGGKCAGNNSSWKADGCIHQVLPASPSVLAWVLAHRNTVAPLFLLNDSVMFRRQQCVVCWVSLGVARHTLGRLILSSTALLLCRRTAHRWCREQGRVETFARVPVSISNIDDSSDFSACFPQAPYMSLTRSSTSTALPRLTPFRQRTEVRAEQDVTRLSALM